MNADTYNSLQALFPVGLRPTEGMKYQGFAALSPTGITACPTGITALIQSIGQQQLANE